MRFIVICLAALAFVAGCGGGGGGGGSTFVPTETSPTGIWEGMINFDIGESAETVGLIAETGEAIFITDDGQMIWAAAPAADCGGFTAAYEWAVAPGTTTPGGAMGGTGQISCTCVERVSMDCGFTSTSSAGEVFTGTMGVTYDDLYEDDSSLSVVEGDWLDMETGMEVLSIDALGNVSSQDAITGCVLNGTILPIDPDYNAYDVSLVLDGCTDPVLVPANGTRFDGMGVVGEELQPQDTLVLGIHGEFMGIPIALPGEFRRM